jgi:hypothetical protein
VTNSAHEVPAFPESYADARRRFRSAAAAEGWSLEACATGEIGPDGEPLTVDAASTGPATAPRLLIVSSGLHGVEGPFGSAVQTAAIPQWRSILASRTEQSDGVRALFIHALNPYGFAWGRRTDSQNVDPNRNLLHSSEPYASDSSAYAKFDRLLNPRRPPSPFSIFTLRMLLAILVNGKPRLKQALVTGQYDFPKGLFYGGSGPTVTHRVLADHASQWLDQARLVLHLDLHTGLGAFGSHKLLIADELPAHDLDILRRCFGASLIETGDPDLTSYRAKGHFGHWGAAQETDTRRYLYACAEFGTYGNVRMLAGLRAENQAHHWAKARDRQAIAAKANLQRLFCPASPEWRQRALEGGLSLVRNGAAGLAQERL